MIEPEYRTKSLVNAAHLVALGHEPLGVGHDRDGKPVLRFTVNVLPDLARYQKAKADLEQVLEKPPKINGQ
jgi:hypothetical protein